MKTSVRLCRSPAKSPCHHQHLRTLQSSQPSPDKGLLLHDCAGPCTQSVTHRACERLRQKSPSASPLQRCSLRGGAEPVLRSKADALCPATAAPLPCPPSSAAPQQPCPWAHRPPAGLPLRTRRHPRSALSGLHIGLRLLAPHSPGSGGPVHTSRALPALNPISLANL